MMARRNDRGEREVGTPSTTKRKPAANNLRSIAGLEEITSGDIVLGGRAITNLAPRDRNIAMVFQSYALYPYLSVFENVAFGLRARKMPQAEIDKKVGWAAELLHIGDYLKRFPRELSGGQRQRVAIGRAIGRDADLFLFDEPLSNLDAKLRDGMREEIKRLHQQLGKTFVYVTHDQIEAMTLAERIVLLREGVIEQLGSPLDLFERPANTFVAGFLGSPSMNVIAVKVEESSSRLRLPDGNLLPFDVPDQIRTAMPDGDYMWGVRPEHFSRAEDGKGAISARMEIVQPTGSRAFGTFFIEGTHVVAELGAHEVPQVGASIALSVAMERTSFFHPDSGQAVKPA
ncbi:MAG: ATP-binding cassette domain-containing protein [Hyphomicrobiales bacterium]|nr:ATP-binding cassette domain-containing protein [Hyphomicrobiales bacterium]